MRPALPFCCLARRAGLVVASLLAACGNSMPVDPSGEHAELIAKLRPLHAKLGEPQAGDWLLSHDEPGQSFAQYVACRPTLPRGRRKRLYILPLGNFTPKQREIVGHAAEFLRLYYALEVRVQKDLALDVIPERARRVHPSWGVKQILSTYVLDEVLARRLPRDAAAYLAFTAQDLWPGRGWNFVFGQASLRKRVGVWSIHRNGDPSASEAEYRLCLLRTLKTATHETGHMFSMQHCTAYECNMCGSNNRSESDRRPLAMCPECSAKLAWGMRIEPASRFARLAAWCAKRGLASEAAFYRESTATLRQSH